jgi:DNA-binding HxlR family transcriptional regulator
MARRSYDHYCAAARALDCLGDRWTLLIVRELMAGARRYTDLHADLPGISTDVLAARLKDLEREGVVIRRRLAPPGVATVYALTPRGRQLLPVLIALAGWGASALAERRPTDAVRAHWFAIPLLAKLNALAQGSQGVIEVRLDEGVFHLRLDSSAPSHGDGPADQPDVRLTMSTAICLEIIQEVTTLATAHDKGLVQVQGDASLVRLLTESPSADRPRAASQAEDLSRT